MSPNTAGATPEQGLAVERLRLLETYFRNQEQLNAMSQAQPQIAARVVQIEAEMRVLEAGRALPKGDA